MSVRDLLFLPSNLFPPQVFFPFVVWHFLHRQHITPCACCVVVYWFLLLVVGIHIPRIFCFFLCKLTVFGLAFKMASPDCQELFIRSLHQISPMIQHSSQVQELVIDRSCLWNKALQNQIPRDLCKQIYYEKRNLIKSTIAQKFLPSSAGQWEYLQRERMMKGQNLVCFRISNLQGSTHTIWSQDDTACIHCWACKSKKNSCVDAYRQASSCRIISSYSDFGFQPLPTRERGFSETGISREWVRQLYSDWI